MSFLLPEDCGSLLDAPHLFHEALVFGLTVLSFDQLPSDERPPRRIWRDGERLKDWFDAVQRKRDAEAKGERQPIEDPVTNPLIKDLIKD